RSRYYHLYINGQYWGVFQTQERAEASYGESHLGGDKDEYDVIKSAGLADGYQAEATDGDFTAWRALYDGVNLIPQLTTETARTEQYMRLQGKNPDGTRNPAYEVLLDADNLINYMLVIFYTGNFDAPISGFLGNNATNNFFSMRRRGGDRGFVHFAHDSEHTLLPEDDRYTSRLGPFPAGSQFNFSNPQWLHQQLMASAEYRLRFADLAQKHLFNNGALTTQKGLERLNRRAAEVQPGMLAESARWGDSKRGTPYGLVDWEREINRLRNQIIPPRNAQIVAQLREARRYSTGMPGATVVAPLFPTVAAPAFNSEGGEVPANFGLQINSSAGTVYYTLDGSDPRAVGGAVSPTALTYSGTITLTQTTTVSARVRTAGGEWSPIVSATFLPGSVAPAKHRVAVTEINYHPTDPTPEEMLAGFTENEEFEFIEVTNLTGSPLDLTGMRFDEGIDFTFGPGTLGPGNRIVVVSNRDAFQTRYGSFPNVAGIYSGQLSNGGEQIRLVAANGEVLFDVTYSDDRPWPTRADGGGSSLELIDPDGDANDVSNWRASAMYLGTPAGVGPASGPGVVINEVLSNTEDPLVDAIELHNTASEAVDVSGWYISDSNNYRKFRIPDATVLEPGGYVVFDEDDFNAPGDTTGFSLNGGRDESLWLVSTSGNNLVTFSDEVHFPAMRLGEALGRWPNGTGDLYSMTAPSLGEVNPGPRVGPVVIREIMYEPPGNNENLEYVEIFNAGSEAEDLTNWRLGEAVDFVFPAGTTLPAGGSVVVVSFLPSENQEKYTAFRGSYWYLGASQVVGGWTGRLDNDGEPVVLYRAGEAPPNNPSNVPLVLEDRVPYRSEAPWPTEAAGEGSALRRIDPFGFPGDPANWTADRKAIDVEDTPALPVRAFALDTPYPNPAQESATVTLSVGSAQRVRLEVFDVLGRRVLQLHDGVLEGPRVHRFEMRFGGLASGLYLIRAVGEKLQDSASVTVVH
ncbi:MAG TPA: lamin tail domain-containing protein, partial [Rhodothermales bacterium]